MTARRIPNFDPIAESPRDQTRHTYGAAERGREHRPAAYAKPAERSDYRPRPRRPAGRPAVRLSHRDARHCPKGPGHRWVVIGET